MLIFPQIFKSEIFYPEQDYVTNYFSGQWHYLPRDFWSILNTEFHLCKIWENVSLVQKYFHQ